MKQEFSPYFVIYMDLSLGFVTCSPSAMVVLILISGEQGMTLAMLSWG